MAKWKTKEDRQKFYNSIEWKAIKENLFSVRGRKCEICGKIESIQVHHLTYDRFGGNEELTDLKILCGFHHMEEHGLIFNNNSRCVSLGLMYVDIVDDLVAGLLLSQIIYWHLPGKTGQTKLRILKGDRKWLAKRRQDWFDECRITIRQYVRAIKILEDMNIVVTKIFKFNGEPTVHISLNQDIFLGLVEKYLNNQPVENDDGE